MGPRVQAAVRDALWLFGLWMAVGLLATAVGFRWSALYLRASAVLFLIALPGWFLTSPARDAERAPDLLLRLVLAHGLSLALYAVLAAACWALGLSFGAWWALHAVATAAALAVACRRGGYERDPTVGRELRAFARTPGALVAAGGIALLASYHRAPVANDLEIFAPQMVAHQEARTFARVSPGMAAFGVDVPPPRFRAQLFHALLALAAEASGTNVAALATWGATVHLGLLTYAALAALLRALAPGLAAAAVAAGPLLPATLLHLPRGTFFEPYRADFVLLNCPTLDKQFALLFLYPFLLLLLLGWLERGRPREPLIGLLSLPMVLLFHPLTGIYLFLGGLVLAAAWPAPLPRRAAAALVLTALAGLLTVAQGGEGDHVWIERLVALDAADGGSHFWGGHYAGLGRDTGEVVWRGGWMLLRPWLYAEALLAAAATGLWAALRRRAPADEGPALRVMAACLLLLVGVYLGATLLLRLQPHLHRGLVRLQWFAFPLLPLAPAHLLARVGAWLAERAGPRAPALRRAAGVALGLYLLPQLVWLQRAPREFMREPVVSRPWLWPLEQARTYPRTAVADYVFHQTELAGYGPRLWEPPEWLRDDDRVYLQTPTDWPESPGAIGWQMTIERYPLIARQVYYAELYHEAWAWQRLGDPFLAAFRAYWDGNEGRVTDRLVEWLRRERVTLVVSPHPGFVDELAGRLGRRARVLEDPVPGQASGVWRLE